jgi:hypothetical protein
VGGCCAACYRLEAWDKPIGKVLHLAWNTVGALPRIVTFRRGANGNNGCCICVSPPPGATMADGGRKLSSRHS